MIELLNKMAKEGIVVKLIDGKLRIFSDKDNIGPKLLEEIKTNKSNIVEFLSKRKSLHTEKEKEVSIPKVTGRNSYPLSSSQKRVWILNQLEKSSLAYNMPFSTNLKGIYDVQVFEKAILSAIERHEILRTVFKENEEGEINQWILPIEQVNFQLDYRDFEQSIDKETEVAQYIEQDVHQTFDLQTGPLIRAGLYRLRENEYIFYFNMHHIISDGWSMNILSKEVFAFYDALVSGKIPDLPMLDIQYKDFSTWQNQLLESDTFEEHRQYWVDRFSGELTLLDLPSVQVRAPFKTDKGHKLSTFLRPQLVKKLKAFCQEEQGSLFMGLLNSWNIFFYKYTAQKDIIIGTPIAGRSHSSLKNQIGLYINTLALRNQVDGEDDLRTAFQKVKTDTLNAFSHQDYPFDQLVENLPLRMNTARNAIFDIMLILQNTSNTKKELNEKEEMYNITDGGDSVSKFDITLTFEEIGEQLHFQVDFNKDVYSKGVIEEMMLHYQQLLENLLTLKDEKIGTCSFLSQKQQKDLIQNFSNKDLVNIPDQTVLDFFRTQVEIRPNKVALISNNAQLTYQDLETRSNQLAAYLFSEHKVDANQIVGISLERTEWLIIAMLGVMKSGGVYLPIDPEFPLARIKYIKENSKCKLCIDQNMLEDFSSKLETYRKGTPDRIVRPKDLAYVIYTSGSTGQPKGVKVEHHALTNFLRSMQKQPGLIAEDRFYAMTTFSFDISILEIFLPLISGASLYFFDNGKPFDVHQAIEQLDEIKPSVIQATPIFYHMLFDQGWTGSPTMKILCGGDTMSEELAQKMITNASEVWNMYGPTETTIWSSIKKIEKASDANNIGKAIDNTSIYILDDYLNPIPPGINGDLYIDGDGLAAGYLYDETLTTDKFVENPFRTAAKMYKTGDVGRWLSDGTIIFSGRNGNLVKLRGYRIELREIEVALEKINEVDQSVVLVKEDEGGEQLLVAYLNLKTPVTHQEIRTYLKDLIPLYMIPEVFINLDEIPLTPNGKIDRKSLPVPEFANTSKSQEYVEPTSDMEEKVVRVLADALKVDSETIGVHDNFFDMGANSMHVVKILNELNKSFDMKLKSVSIFKHPNVHDLVKFLSTEQTNQQKVEDDLNISDDMDVMIEMIKF